MGTLLLDTELDHIRSFSFFPQHLKPRVLRSDGPIFNLIPQDPLQNSISMKTMRRRSPLQMAVAGGG